MDNTLAPIILFVYNRPWHTEQTLEALMKNELADQSTLYIYSDGPKNDASEEDLKNIKDVRTLIRKKKWCKEVLLIERNKNLGLANSVINGVSEVIEKHGKVIVLEDDIVTGTYFLKFMNINLNFYEHEKRVYGISGYQFSPSIPIKQFTYFLPIMSSWGYATWANKWKKINFDGQELLMKVDYRNLGKKLDFGSLHFYQMLKDCVAGKNSSWAVRFNVSMFINDGLFLYPNKSLLHNIGFDGSGIHCGSSPSLHYKNEENINKFIKTEKIPVALNKEIVRNSIKGSLGNTTSDKTGLKNSIKNIFSSKSIQFAKRMFKMENTSVRDKQSLLFHVKKKSKFSHHKIFPRNIATFILAKTAFKKVLNKAVTNNLGWFILKPLADFGNFIYLSRKRYLGTKKPIKEGSNLTVIETEKFRLITQEGPFKGMVYPSMKSVGSSLYPKLIGSYEKELWPILNEIKTNVYSNIIDIGCAEGYYAVGLARMFDNAIINAYDINLEARQLCREMAVVNNVEDRVNVHTNISSEILQNFKFNGRGLIVCDCEGCENNIFNHSNVDNMKNCDLIIETHDFLDINISVKIKELFKKTHDLISVKSIDDIEKAHTYKFKVLDNVTLENKLLYLSEHRPKIMEWVICKSKMKNS